MFERWIGRKKEMYITVYPERRSIRLSKGLVAEIGSPKIDIFVDEDTHAFGFRPGDDVKVRPDGSISKTTFIGWLGIKHTAKISVRFSKKEKLFVGKIQKASCIHEN